MKKILQISKYMYPFIGGIEQVARDIIHVLKDQDIEQKVICFNEDAQNDEYICRKGETVHDYIDDIEVVRCGYFLKISSQSLSVTYALELDRIMNEFKPDIIIFHYPNPFAAHLLLKYKKRDFKLVLYWHLDITKQKILKKVFHRQNLSLINRADRIIGATPKHINDSEYSFYFGEKKSVLPYMINEKNLLITDVELKLAEKIKKKYSETLLGFFVGRHVPYKGLKYLIEASRKIQSGKIHFLIAGQGALTGELKLMAHGDTKIDFLGRISDSERRAYLYACDIICFPSITRNEAFGLALAEGMYYGKPAITFTIKGSGVNYVNLNNVTGIECPNRDSDAYARALELLCNDDQLRLRLGQNAQKRITQNFTEEHFRINIQNLIASL